MIIMLFIAISAGFSSCKKYLEVTPKSSLSEGQLFTSEPGFQQALSGVYSQLAGRNLYGDKLTMGFVSALGQNYSITNNSYIQLVETRNLNYATGEVQGHISGIWGTAYAAIAGLNKILVNSVENRKVLTDEGYALVRGEALALRALLHFDLLRLFGKEYVTGASLKAIPYKTDITENANVPATTAEVVKFALEDLKEAETLLKDKDPIVTRNTRSRRNRLNYYAVKGLEARIRIYMGDKAGAAAAAAIVVNSGKYTFVTNAAASVVSAGSNVRDRLYFNEQIAMVRVREISNWADPTYFRFNAGASYKLTRSDANFKTLYETATGGGTDIRYLYRIELDGGVPFPSKFWQTTTTTLDSARLDQYVPVIRLAEMYYILAETAATPAEGFGYLNTVRINRALPVLLTTGSQITLNNEITKEYQKEFYAEGQLFFYYKRKNMARMQFMTADISQDKYVLPIPDTELEFNPNY